MTLNERLRLSNNPYPTTIVDESSGLEFDNDQHKAYEEGWDRAVSHVLSVLAEATLEELRLTDEPLLTGADGIFVDEITQRCCYAPRGTIHSEVQYTALHFKSEGKKYIIAKILPVIEAAKRKGRQEVAGFIDNLIIGVDGCKFEQRLDGDKGCLVLDMNDNQWQDQKKSWGLAPLNKETE